MYQYKCHIYKDNINIEWYIWN